MGFKFRFALQGKKRLRIGLRYVRSKKWLEIIKKSSVLDKQNIGLKRKNIEIDLPVHFVEDMEYKVYVWVLNLEKLLKLIQD